MKKVLILALLLIVSKPVIASGNWTYDLENAKKMAIATNKLIFVDFTASWCGPCKRMERESWSNEEVKKMMSNYIPVQIDLDTNRDIAQKYDVRGIPNILVLDASGKVIFQEMSYKTKNQVLKLLDKYALNMQYLQNTYVSYFKKKTIVSTYRLANKLQEYSLYLKSDLRKSFLNLADSYSEETKKLLKHDKSDTYKSLPIKLKFMRIKEAIFLGKGKKALKVIAKIDSSKLDAFAYAEYCFFNHAAYKLNKKDEEAQKWLEKLEKTGKDAPYKKKLELLFT